MAAEAWLFAPIVESTAATNATARNVLMFFDIGRLLFFVRGQLLVHTDQLVARRARIGCDFHHKMSLCPGCLAPG